MKKIGFIGLGTMGLPIATNLMNANYQLYVGFHQDKRPAEYLSERGAIICSSYKDVAFHSDVIFTVVPDARQVEEVVFGTNGLAEGIKEGSTIIDMSTIDLLKSREFAARLNEINVNFLDAPISGGPKGASSATLAIMVGGNQTVFQSNKEIFDTIGKNIVYCGSNGLGLAAKMANNLIASAQMVAISEAMCLAIKAGIDPDVLFEVLRGATANSTILNLKVPSYLKDDYSPGFKLALMCKDLNIVTTVAKKLGTPTLVGSLVEQIYDLCKEEYGEKDSGAVSLYYQKQTGISFKSQKDS